MSTPEPAFSGTNVRRQVAMLIALVDLLVLGIGVVACVDLSRLRTPGGTALRWVQAAAFGDCDDYLAFSVADRLRPESRSEGQLCKDLRAATQQAREQALRIGLHLGPVRESGGDATVKVTLTRDGKATELVVHLVRRDGAWRVLRDERTCNSVGCA